MTALTSLAASSLFALTAGAPMNGAPPARSSNSSAHQAPQHGEQGGQQGNARNPPPERAGSSAQGSAPQHQAPASAGPNNGRTPPPRSGATHTRPASAPPARPAPAHARPASPPPPRTVYVGPRPPSGGVVVVGSAPPPPHTARRAPSGKSQAPAREVNRDESFAVGLRTGTLASGYENGASYSDFGVGFNARYRPTESLGLELSYGYYSDSFNDRSERTTQPLAASVEVFAFPSSRISPYALVGTTWTKRSYNDTYGLLPSEIHEGEDLQFGPHAGLGLEFAIGKQAALDLEGRYNTFVTDYDTDPSLSGSLQGTLGLNVYF